MRREPLYARGQRLAALLCVRPLAISLIHVVYFIRLELDRLMIRTQMPGTEAQQKRSEAHANAT